MELLLGLGLIIGVLLGVLGAGGSILAVPALVYAAGQPLAVAVPTSLLVVGSSAATAVIPRIRSRQVQWRLAAVFGLAGVPAAFAGAAASRQLEPRIVLTCFSLLMVVAAIRMLQEQPELGTDCALPSGRVNWASCLPKAIGAGAVVGFLTGLFGVGGGFLIIPALVLLLGLPMSAAVGTSLVIVTVNSAAGYLAHAGTVELDYRLALGFTGAAMVGAALSSRIAARIGGTRLARWFAYVLFAVAAFGLLEAVTNPAVGG